ncbi:MAG: nitroreductase family protein [Desulfobacterales bacterium]|nr:nitroreductase family protein [Desulfobacterales bacterium]
MESALDIIIQKRRSIRRYKSDIPNEQLIYSMIECAAYAPSPSNSQPVRFIRVNSKDLKDKLSTVIKNRFNEYLTRADSKKIKNLIKYYFRFTDFMFTAPILFAVGVVKNTESFSKKLFESGLINSDLRGNTDLDISLGLALKGFLLKGHELGLGTCILTAPLVFVSDASDLLGIDEIRIKCFVTVGFPDETPQFIEKRLANDIYMEI